MRLFISTLSNNKDSGDVTVIPDITVPYIIIEADNPPLVPFYSFMFFKPFVAADFPEITGLTKKYLFLYCSDHETGENAGSFWAQGDNLDASDIVFGGRIIDGLESSETPWIYRIDENTIAVTWHPDRIYQQTYMATTTGGSLTEICDDFSENTAIGWTGHGIVLPWEQVMTSPGWGTDPHTGYAKFFKRGTNDYMATSVYRGGRGGDSLQGPWYSTDGINFTIGDYLPRTIPGMDTLYNSNEVFATTFQKNGVWWLICAAVEGDGNEIPDNRKMYLASCDDEYGTNAVFKKWMYDFQDIRGVQCYQDDDTLHLYINFDRYTFPGDGTITPLYHSTLDISNADKWE